MRTPALGLKPVPVMDKAADAEKERDGNNRNPKKGLPGGQDRNTVEPSSYQAKGQPT